MDIWYISWIFGIFHGDLVIFFPVWYVCTKENLATLISTVMSGTLCFKGEGLNFGNFFSNIQVLGYFWNSLFAVTKHVWPHCLK
jgi:hypothetical protein